jgi:uncharacterized protein YeeX (DUF496 family)
MIEQRKQSIAIFVKFKEKELLLKHMLKEEGRMLQDNSKRLHGSANFSQYGFCKDCKRDIQDRSRSRKRSRCEICSVNHIIKIKQLSAERVAKERKEKSLAQKRKEKIFR